MEIVTGALAIVVLLSLVVAMLRRSTPRDRRRCSDGTGVFPECLYIVRSDTELSVTRPDGTVAQIPMAEVREIVVETNDSGPGGTDVWWHVSGPAANGPCSFPERPRVSRPRSRSFRPCLPSTTWRSIEAMGSTSNKRFVVWSQAVDRPPT